MPRVAMACFSDVYGVCHGTDKNLWIGRKVYFIPWKALLCLDSNSPFHTFVNIYRSRTNMRSIACTFRAVRFASIFI